MTAVWIALVLLVLDLVGMALLVRKRASWSLLRWRWVAVAVGVSAAACACLLRYPYTDKYLALGFPLPAAAFEIATGADFLVPLTLPILCFDAFLVATLPLATLAIATALRGRARSF